MGEVVRLLHQICWWGGLAVVGIEEFCSLRDAACRSINRRFVLFCAFLFNLVLRWFGICLNTRRDVDWKWPWPYNQSDRITLARDVLALGFEPHCPLCSLFLSFWFCYTLYILLTTHIQFISILSSSSRDTKLQLRHFSAAAGCGTVKLGNAWYRHVTTPWPQFYLVTLYNESVDSSRVFSSTTRRGKEGWWDRNWSIVSIIIYWTVPDGEYPA